MRKTRYRAHHRAADAEPTEPAAISRRGILVVTGGIATHLVGCTGSGEGGGGPGGAGGSTGAGGSAGASGGGTGGSGGSSGGTGGSPGTGGASGGAGGSAGRDGGGTGGSGGSGGSAGAGGRDAGSPADASYPSDARIEVGSPPGMVDGATMSCRQTASDQLGPYYKSGHQMRSTIATASDGDVLIVSGRVLNTRCEPLANATVDVWQANGRGVYSEVGSGWGRGIVKTDANGHYQYETVYPGPYQGRPRHIHLIVSQPGYSKLTTQMYFVGANPDIPANAAPRVVMGSMSTASWDIVLRPTGMAAVRPAPGPQPPKGSRIIQPHQIPRRFWAGWGEGRRRLG